MFTRMVLLVPAVQLQRSLQKVFCGRSFWREQTQNRKNLYPEHNYVSIAHLLNPVCTMLYIILYIVLMKCNAGVNGMQYMMYCVLNMERKCYVLGPDWSQQFWRCIDQPSIQPSRRQKQEKDECEGRHYCDTYILRSNFPVITLIFVLFCIYLPFKGASRKQLQ